MPVRRIPRNYLHVTGRVSIADSDKSVAFESPLERDFYILMDYDTSVAGVEEQPVRIHYVGPSEVGKSYVPDALVTYVPSMARPKLLCEIKSRADLRENWSDYCPGFRAAVRHARAEGWRFRIFTEIEIRTPYLDNIKLLREYRSFPGDELFKRRLLKHLLKVGGATLEEVLLAMTPAGQQRGWFLSQIWHLLAAGALSTDLSCPIAYSSVLRVASNMPANDG